MNTKIDSNITNNSAHRKYSEFVLNSFILKGYKAFKSRQEIPIRPITLIFGPNSAGKSSILKAIRDSDGFINSINEGKSVSNYSSMRNVALDSEDALEFGFEWQHNIKETKIIDGDDLAKIFLDEEDCYKVNNMYVNKLQNKVIYGDDTSVTYCDEIISIKIKNNKIVSIEGAYLEELLEAVVVAFETNPCHDKSKTKHIKNFVKENIKRVNIDFNKGYVLFDQGIDVFSIKPYDEERGDELTKDLKDDMKRFSGISEPEDSIHSFFIDTLEAKIRMYGSKTANTRLNLYAIPAIYIAQQLLIHMHYSDAYVHVSMKKSNIFIAPNVTYVSSNREMNEINGLLFSKDRLMILNDWLGRDRLNTNYQVIYSESYISLNEHKLILSGDMLFENAEIIKINQEELRVEDIRYPGKKFIFEDLGFGLKKIIPVILSVTATEDMPVLAIIEEPEMHLHPKLQSDLGDLFVDNVINNSCKTFILETHSENLLQRVLRRVREGVISHEAVSVLYVHPGVGDEGARVERLEIDEDGEFKTRWPDGFFDPREIDILS